MRALVIDTETSGLIANRSMLDYMLPEVIEFCGLTVDFSTGCPPNVIHEIDTLIKPVRPIDEASKNFATHHISNDMLAAAPTFREAFHDLGIREAIESVPIVIAHNASFDVEAIDVEVERIKATKIAWPRVMCTVEQTCHIKGYRMSLNDMHMYLFDKPLLEAHRARTDVDALVRCVAELIVRGEI